MVGVAIDNLTKAFQGSAIVGLASGGNDAASGRQEKPTWLRSSEPGERQSLNGKCPSQTGFGRARGAHSTFGGGLVHWAGAAKATHPDSA